MSGWDRYRRHENPEKAQAVTRLMLIALIFTYFAFADNPTLFRVAALYFAASLAFLGWIYFMPDENQIRRVVMALGDISVTTVCLSFSDGEEGVLFVALFLWIITGHGFRYGVRHLYLTTALAALGFSGVVLATPFWLEHLHIAIGNMVLIVVVPMFMARLIAKLNSAVAQAKAANEAKTQFITNVSHELRTPLNGIIGMSDLLVSTHLDQEQKRFASVVRQSAQHLLGLIEQILDMSRIEAGKAEVVHEPFDLHQLVHGVVSLFEREAKEKEIRIDFHIEPDVPFDLLGDPRHLKQVLLNLVGNAVKFTHEGFVDVCVSCAAVSDTAVTIRFEIMDTGIGIPEAAQDKIFEQFTQADGSVTRQFGGTGLGTTISKNLVEMMGGSIGLHSKEGEGTVFHVEIPFEMQPKKEGPKKLSQMRALVIATDTVLHRLAAVMERWEVSFDVIPDEGHLLSRLVDAWTNGQAYDVVILDRMGLTLKPERIIESIRGKEVLSDLRTILIDQENNSALDQFLLHAGFSTVLHMPLQDSLLFNALHAASVVHADDVISMGDIFRRRQDMPPLHVLVAEDNPVNQEVMREILQRAGHRVRIVEDGEKALDALAADDAYDLVFLDMNMPGVSGLDVLRQFRFMDTSGETPVIMLSADALPETIQGCMEAGANDYLTKPVDINALFEAIARCVGKKEKMSVAVTPAQKPLSAGDAEVLDEKVLEDLLQFALSPKQLADLVRVFEDSGQNHVESLKSSAGKGHGAKFSEIVHTLHGSAGSIGAARLAALCNEAEHLRGRLDRAAMRVWAEKISSAFVESCTALHGFLERQMHPKL